MSDSLETILSRNLKRYFTVRRGTGTLVFYFLPYRPVEYPAGCGEIDAYFFASNRAYERARRLAAELSAAGVPATQNAGGDYKSILTERGICGRAANTLCFTEELGTRFAVGALEISAELPETPAGPRRECARCGACVAACPTGALAGGVFHRERCLRQVMTGCVIADDGVSAALGTRVLGCDACQRACPMNARIYPEQAGEELSELTAFPALLERLAENRLQPLAALIGSNYARRGKLVNFAVNAAGNGGERACLVSLAKIRADGFAAEGNLRRAEEKLRRRNGTWGI